MSDARTALILAAAAAAVAAASSAGAQEPFAATGPAFLEKHCVACHGETKQKGGLALHQFRDDASLLKARKKWQHVLEQVERREMPPDDKPQPSDAERAAFLAGARAVFQNYDRTAKPDPGRVTLRRLNRAEYNNTIRDLLGIDAEPAKDFPGDDVGHGFDNIGDVLSVSPVLMERYLDAAQSVAELAVPDAKAKPYVKQMASIYCEPAGGEAQLRGKWRAFTPGRQPWLSGPMHTPFTPEPAMEFRVRARVYAESPDARPVRVALLVTGDKLQNPEPDARLAAIGADKLPQTRRCRVLKTIEVTARDEAHAQVIEAPLPPTAGIERMALAVERQPGAPAATVWVEWIQAEQQIGDDRPQFLRRWAPAGNKPPAQQLRDLLAAFMPRAWRRPVSPDELDRATRVGLTALQRDGRLEPATRQALVAILSSPKFIFRMEPDDDPGNPEAHPINEFQLAARLSYFLWSTCPDDELLALAQRGRLSAELPAQVARMLRDKRADALTDNFAMQWLQLRRLVNHAADESVFKRWRPTLKNSMLTETRLFFSEIVRTDRSVLDLIDADFTYADRRLGEIYGINGLGDEFKRVSLAGTARGGLLTHASVLTVTSNPTRTSPVKRGKWILEQILGDPPPPPPPNVPSIDDNSRKELSGSFRQRLEQHRADPKCGGCHAKMDAMGLALENFNGIGQWRDKNEQGQPVEVGGEFQGLTISGLADLRKFIRDRKDEFAQCLSEKMLIYALGRGLEYYDDRAVAKIRTELAAGGYKFSALVTAIARSDPFRLRRGTTQ